jgi:trigger factor
MLDGDWSSDVCSSDLKVKEYFQSREDLMPLMHELLNEKILGYLREQAVLVAPAQTETTTENDGAES